MIIRDASRRGIVIVPIIVALVIVSSICMGLMRLGLSQRRMLLQEERRLQADWLAESGLERGVSLARARADYDGEDWDLGPEQLAGRESGRVEIRLADDPAGSRILEVRAEYPAGSLNRGVVRKQVVLDLRNRPQSPKPESQP